MRKDIIKKIVKAGLIIVLSMGIMLKISACTEEKSKEQANNVQSEKHLEEYDSPYTIGVLNADNTYSMYIFASPIQYKIESGYKFINNEIIDSSNEKYRFQNAANEIKTFFPKRCEEGMYICKKDTWLNFILKEGSSLSEGICQEYVNMYGDVVKAIVYEGMNYDFVVYPISSGIKTEIIIKKELKEKKFNFSAESSGDSLIDENIDYVRIMKGEENHAVIYCGLSKSEDKIQTSRFKLESSQKEGEKTLDFSINLEELDEREYPLILDVSFELYRNKMPDSSVYSKLNKNMYLNNYAIVGNEENKGYSKEYIRFRINHFFSIRSDTILEATYNTRRLFVSDESFTSAMTYIGKMWASTQVTWETRVIPEGRQIFEEKEEGVYDITDYVKLCVADQENLTEMCGCILQGESGYGIYASADNGSYIPYIHLKLSKKPRAFIARENINP